MVLRVDELCHRLARSFSAFTAHPDVDGKTRGANRGGESVGSRRRCGGDRTKVCPFPERAAQEKKTRRSTTSKLQ